MRTSAHAKTLTWRKSSHSNGMGGDCVEVASGTPGVIPVRDSKIPAHGMLTLPASTWEALTHTLKHA
ncbi:DUF397 domain-containing protein [Yinghuangia sp. ASG 101]|uniref:DUF397 domain-containing protein n=1 Tax=Yinghuangia sp. ASG 101 TaxID=2896848 RepID=UPI001E42DA6B|nr:DUF397 domain-containing protein [Yinghuangia sp. ASG 101]UGQ13378.1 DUF397 domain-containing protein [Yinghuangia sp. ASG 101]